MNREFRIFGNSFDPANSPERLELKRAYVSYLQNTAGLSQQFDDPYDFIKSDLVPRISHEYTWVGKVPIDSWLTPHPRLSDLPLLNAYQCTEFLEKNGCWDYSLQTAEFVEKQIFPSAPVMIGVDHSLTGGLLLALTKKYDNVNVIVVDAHFDVMKFSRSAFKSDGQQQLFYHCGNFLSYILEKGTIHPENLWIVGVSEKAFTADNYHQMDSISRNNADEAKKWIGKGVHVRFKEDIDIEEMKLTLNGPTYISIDMDAGSLSSIFSARYMTCYGLPVEKFLSLLSGLALSIRAASVPILGLDIMETDIHLLEVTDRTPFQDNTQRIVREIFKLFLE